MEEEDALLNGWSLCACHTWVQCSAWTWNRPFKNQQCWGLVSVHCPSNSPQQGLKTCCTTDCNEDRWLHCVALHWAWPSARTVHSAYKHVQGKRHNFVYRSVEQRAFTSHDLNSDDRFWNKSSDIEIKRWHLDIETLSNFNNFKFYSWTSSISEYIKTVWNTKILAENVQLVTRICWMNAHFNTSVVVPAKLSFVTSQQPSFSPLAWRRGCKVCTCWRLSAWSSLIHGGKSAPTDTNCDCEGPINGLGRLVYMTEMLPRNVSGSKTNNTYLLAYLHQCLLYLHNKLSIRSLFF